MYIPALKVCAIPDAHLMYSNACIWRDVCPDCFCSCELHCFRAE